MNIDQIRELAEILRQNELCALEYAEGDARVRLERATVSAPQPAVSVALPIAAPSAPQPAPSPAVSDPGVDFSRVHEVKSPLVGVFYAAPSPDAAPFAEVGSQVRAGDVICIVEAMKLMNEITADRDGKVVDCCVKNGDVVEYGQTLFKLY